MLDLHAAAVLIDLDRRVKLHDILVIDDLIDAQEALELEDDDDMLAVDRDRLDLGHVADELAHG